MQLAPDLIPVAGLEETSFEEMLSSVGFAVRQIPTKQLHPEYQGGQYKILQACRLGPEADSNGTMVQSVGQ